MKKYILGLVFLVVCLCEVLHPYWGDAQWGSQVYHGNYTVTGTLESQGLLTASAGVTATSGTFSTTLAVTGHATFDDRVTTDDSLFVSREQTIAGADSSMYITTASGNPYMGFRATDGDLTDITVNTSDQLLFQGASGGYSFDDDVITTANIIGLQQVFVLDSAIAPDPTQSGSMWVCRPITAKRTATLPAAAVGLNFTFFIDDADSLLITVASGDSLITSAGAAWVTTSSVAGTVKVVAVDAVRWVMVFTLGTWTSY